jgi:hypothetical protein
VQQDDGYRRKDTVMWQDLLFIIYATAFVWLAISYWTLYVTHGQELCEREGSPTHSQEENLEPQETAVQAGKEDHACIDENIALRPSPPISFVLDH